MSRRLAQGFDAEASRHPHAEVDAVVAFGANLGDRSATIAAAREALAGLPLVSSVRMSTPIESVAVKLDGPDAAAPAYLNAVALVTTRLAPTVLLAYLHAIEQRHGRERHERWGDRTLDLDLVTYGEVVADGPGLVLPHPRAAERDFVLVPWLEIDPDAVIPGIGRADDALRRLRESS